MSGEGSSSSGTHSKHQKLLKTSALNSTCSCSIAVTFPSEVPFRLVIPSLRGEGLFQEQRQADPSWLAKQPHPGGLAIIVLQDDREEGEARVAQDPTITTLESAGQGWRPSGLSFVLCFHGFSLLQHVSFLLTASERSSLS